MRTETISPQSSNTCEMAYSSAWNDRLPMKTVVHPSGFGCCPLCFCGSRLADASWTLIHRPRISAPSLARPFLAASPSSNSMNAMPRGLPESSKTGIRIDEIVPHSANKSRRSSSVASYDRPPMNRFDLADSSTLDFFAGSPPDDAFVSGFFLFAVASGIGSSSFSDSDSDSSSSSPLSSSSDSSSSDSSELSSSSLDAAFASVAPFLVGSSSSSSSDELLSSLDEALTSFAGAGAALATFFGGSGSSSDELDSSSDDETSASLSSSELLLDSSELDSAATFFGSSLAGGIGSSSALSESLADDDEYSGTGAGAGSGAAVVFFPFFFSFFACFTGTASLAGFCAGAAAATFFAAAAAFFASTSLAAFFTGASLTAPLLLSLFLLYLSFDLVGFLTTVAAFVEPMTAESIWRPSAPRTPQGPWRTA